MMFAAGRIRIDAPPLLPDGDDARSWAEREVQRPEYQAAQPTPLDRVARAAWDWVQQLFQGPAPDALGAVFLPIVIALIVAVVVIAFIVWGRPRRVQVAASAFAPLFGDADSRSASELRQAAANAATAGDWRTAIVVRQRASARGLQERGVLDLSPGATVHAFARAAQQRFPTHVATIAAAADVFDDVRYLRRPATPAGYAAVAAADEALLSATPTLTASSSPLATAGAP